MHGMTGRLQHASMRSYELLNGSLLSLTRFAHLGVVGLAAGKFPCRALRRGGMLCDFGPSSLLARHNTCRRLRKEDEQHSAPMQTAVQG